MLDSKRVSDLNSKSVQLTDAELSLVDRFSVSLPMNELPEIVVVGSGVEHSEKSDRQDEPAVIPFKQDTPAQKLEAVTDQALANQETTGVETEGLPVDSLTGSEIALPEDELDLSPSRDSIESDQRSPKATEQAVSEQIDGHSADADFQDAAVFKIEEFAPFQSRFESIASNLEKNLARQFPAIVAITSPAENSHQNKIVSSVVLSLAQSNPRLKMIAIQAYEFEEEANRFSIGLGQVLGEEHGLEEAVIPTSIENLDYLAYSQFESVLSATFKSRFEKMLGELKKHYDLVIVNSNCATEVETKVITEIADATYLLVALQEVDQELTIHATEDLRKNGAHLAGCILTEAE